MDLNALLNIRKEDDISPQQFESRAYWFRHIYNLYNLNLPVQNRYEKGYFAHACCKRAISLIFQLAQQHGKITEETFTDALGRAVPEVIFSNSSRG
jgi:hypothetical protein